MHAEMTSFPSELISKMVHCVEEAVGSDIRADMANLATSNSISSRIWDLLNTNLIKNLKDDCTVLTTNRYRWQMMIIFEKNIQCIFTFMREKRFAQLCRLQYSG